MKIEYQIGGKNMERKKKLFVTMILSISILLGVLTSENYAVNEVNEVNNTTTQTSTNIEANKNTTNQTTAKSSNANLSDFGITPHDFTGFKYGTTSYEVVVPEDTEVVEVYAKTQHAKATVTGTGKKNLEKGENKAEVVVTAEDGTKKTYTINIIREIKQEEEQEENNTVEETTSKEEKKGLAELKIDKLSLVPEFKTDVYEYKVKYIGENTILNIETKPTSENYVVEVTGNENLKEGENIITILVSDKNGDNVATYQITVNKSLVDEEAMAREEDQKKEEQKKIIIGVAIAVVILVIIVFIIIRHRRNKNLAEEFSGVSFYGNDEEEEYEEEIPRGLRKKKREQEEIDEEEYVDNNGEEYEEDEIEKMPKEKLKEKFLNNYTSSDDVDFDDGYRGTKRKGKYKGKRFK